MNAIQLLSSQPWVEQLGWTLVHFLWQGLLIAAVYVAVRRSLRSSSSNARYLFACGALATMMIAPIVTWHVLGQSTAAPSSNDPVVAAPIAASSTAAAGLSRSANGAGGNTRSGRLLSWVVAVWLVGAVVFWGRLVAGWIAAARMRSTQVRPASYEWQAALTRLGTQIGVSWPVQLLVSAFVQVPTVVGWIRPVVLMPVGALAGLPPEQLEALLLHELAHIRRHDYLVNILQSVAEAILFYHPAVWWISAHIRTERELCCDDVAVAASGDVLMYARALADLESQRPAHMQTAMAANGGSLAPRIARLLGQPQRDTRAVSGPGIMTSAALTLAAAFGVFVILFFSFNATAQTPAQSQAKANVARGIAAFDQFKFEIAAGYFEQALKLDPNLTEAELYLARTHGMQYVPGKKSSQNDELAKAAINGFQSVLQKEPKNVIAAAGLASVYQNSMDLRRAHDLYIQVAQLRPLDPAAFYAIGSINWMLVYDRQAPKPAEEKMQLIEEGIRDLDIALALNADYVDAMTYRNLLLREKATLTANTEEKRKLTAEADDWFNKAIQTRKRLAEKPAAATPNGPIDFAPPPPPPPPPAPGIAQKSFPAKSQETVNGQFPKIGMDQLAVVTAMGRPDKKLRDPENFRYEQWIYYTSGGLRTLSLTFEDYVVVRIQRLQ